MATELEKTTAWQKARKVIGYDPNQVRMDDFGHYIVWGDYGNRESDYGWEVDHIRPTVLGGLDTLGNIRALNWRNNASLGGLLSGARGR